MEKLYDTLAEWWPLLSPPSEYAEEAEVYRQCLEQAGDAPARTVLELGSGGGNTASHLKRHFELTLVDRSEGMLAQSRRLNPECEHLQGDMRTVRVGRTFDRVFIHDAIGYMTSLDDLRRALETAFVHLGPGGGVVVAPDDLRETFHATTSHGGHDGAGRSLRYLEWTWDPDPSDSTYIADYSYLLRDADGEVTAVHDRHVQGLFSREEWLRVFREVGFEPLCVTVTFDQGATSLEVFGARRPRGLRMPSTPASPLIDITPAIGPALAVWPGDTPPTREVLLDMQAGDTLTLSTLRGTVHLGAHADAPSHYGADAPTIEQRDLSLYVGPCQVIHVHAARGQRITAGDFANAEITEPRVLIATSTFPDPTRFNDDFAALAPDLVDWLHARRVRLVGIDTPSVDLFSDGALLSHHRFLAHDMAILEGLVLKDVPAGVYELLALPLKLAGFDASPVRAVLRPTTPATGRDR
jgi:arylformamidase